MKQTKQTTHNYPVMPSHADFSYNSVLTAARIERAAYAREITARFSKWLGRKLIAPLVAIRRRQLAFEELTSLDDHTLADIGITRGDIPYLLKDSANHEAAGNDNSAKAA
ncbi:MAG: DUF1127 domain-containing protein [Alphaproteobacteria bacterium]